VTGPAAPDLQPYDAVVLVSFGGPESAADVVPFLRNVTRGRGIPDERLAEVGEHYSLFGGRSPINDQCRALIAALSDEFDRRGISLPIYWGNRNWNPYLADTLATVEAAGHRRVLAVITSAYPSYSSCRQYRENLYDAAEGTALEVDRLRHYANHPGFVEASVAAVIDAVGRTEAGTEPRLIFVTHSIPTTMAEASGDGGYVAWHQTVLAEVTRRAGQRLGRELTAELAYCSRSGPPSQPWLEPDINDRMAELAEQGVRSVVTVPIGFISDHMEVIFDLDTEAAATAERLGLGFVRAATAGVAPVFVAGLVDLIEERAAAARGEDPDRPVAAGHAGWYECPIDCCRNLRAPDRPALCQTANQDQPLNQGR
jgi:ferrochelatase